MRGVDNIELSLKYIKTRGTPNTKSVHGIGYLGNANKTYNSRLYAIWHSMLSRCYNIASPDYKYYGGIGVYVGAPWHCFETFIKDVVTLTGWDDKVFIDGKLALDKDKICEKMGLAVKYYSKQTCTWLTRSENVAIRNDKVQSSQRYFTAISPLGESYCSNSQSQFARDYGLNRKHINDCLNNRQPHHKGWKFKYREEKQ